MCRTGEITFIRRIFNQSLPDVIHERGYFRSPGRGGFFSKKRRRNFSRSRMTLRVGAIESSMFVVSQKMFLEPCDLKFFLSLVKVQGISFLRVSEWQNLEISKSKFPKNVQRANLKIRGSLPSCKSHIILKYSRCVEKMVI